MAKAVTTKAAQNKAEVLREVEQAFGRVPKWIDQFPEATIVGFWSQFRDLDLAETSIPNKYKELIGLAVSGATRCRYCALFHTEAARLNGATDEEIAEASAMAGLTMQASTFLNAMQVDYDEFKEETLAIVKYVREQMAKNPPAKAAQAEARV
jgi:AhpD family alkylhydroperoxidase